MHAVPLLDNNISNLYIGLEMFRMLEKYLPKLSQNVFKMFQIRIKMTSTMKTSLYNKF